jgi:hypothetical protein
MSFQYSNNQENYDQVDKVKELRLLANRSIIDYVPFETPQWANLQRKLNRLMEFAPKELVFELENANRYIC